MERVDLCEMLKMLNVSQRLVASWLIDEGYYSDTNINNLVSRINIALTGRRETDTYDVLLSQIETVVNNQVASCF